jgi:hypothetical protein
VYRQKRQFPPMPLKSGPQAASSSCGIALMIAPGKQALRFGKYSYY